MKALAPGKVNLSLFLGELRADGRHELVTLLQSVSLADELSLITHEQAADEVICPGVHGQNLAMAALVALRERGWSAPPVRLEIQKRIPVAGGMGGGSADAAAALRLARKLEPLADPLLEEVARRLGSDVPGQLAPGLSIGTGAGELVEPRKPLAPHALLLLPQPFELSTAEVYREADRLGLPRSPAALASIKAELLRALAPEARLPEPLLVNDLQPAALSLAPALAEALAAASASGAEQTIVCGSGPTVAGLYWGSQAEDRAEAAAHALAPKFPGACTAVPVPAEFGSPTAGSGTI